MRIEVGPRDVEQGTCVAARRDRPGKEGKQFGIPLDPQGFAGAVQTLLDEVQVCLGFPQPYIRYSWYFDQAKGRDSLWSAEISRAAVGDRY